MNTKFGLSANGLKWIAILAMVIDHIAWQATLPPWGFFVMHMAGRMTMPIMCFLVAEGYSRTRDVNKYTVRLVIFAIISQGPFNYFWHGDLIWLKVGLEYFNVIFCLLLGLCSLRVAKSTLPLTVKIVLIVPCLAASVLCDWFLFGPLWILGFGMNRSELKRQVLWFSVVGLGVVAASVAMAVMSDDLSQLMQVGVFLALLLFVSYNGQKSGTSAPAWLANKWIFYVFYPAHLVVIGALRYGIGLLK